MPLTRPLGIRSVVTWLPPTTVSACDAEATGLVTAADRADTAYDRLPVTDEAPPSMAVRAAGHALVSGGVAPGDVGLLAHAWTYHQGHDFWSPAHYVAARLEAVHSVPVGIQAMCNGGGIALELAADHVSAEGRRPAALVTTADRFDPPGFDRWRGDYGLWYGDGATAAVLHRDPGPDDALHLLALETTTDATAEEMHRGDDPFSPAPRTHSPTVDIRRTKKAYLARRGADRFAAVVAGKVPKLLRSVLDSAGLASDDPRIAAVALPRLGRKALATSYLPAIAGVTPAPAVDLGAVTGHLGAGDLLANLEMSTATHQPTTGGDVTVVLSAGGGFSWTAAVVARPAGTTP